MRIARNPGAGLGIIRKKAIVAGFRLCDTELMKVSAVKFKIRPAGDITGRDCTFGQRTGSPGSQYRRSVPIVNGVILKSQRVFPVIPKVKVVFRNVAVPRPEQFVVADSDRRIRESAKACNPSPSSLRQKCTQLTEFFMKLPEGPKFRQCSVSLIFLKSRKNTVENRSKTALRKTFHQFE